MRAYLKDEEEAVRWFRKSAEQGYANAQFDLGFSYALGEGHPEDDYEAMKWFRKAAEQGHANAQYKLGESYANGTGVNQNLILSYQWLTLAAGQRDQDAFKGLKIVSKLMTPDQITEAQEITLACFSNNYIGCD